ncbi:hypothetical protein NKG05_16660 [Oerskovia sp. M15]
MTTLTQKSPQPRAAHRRNHPGFVLYVGMDATADGHPQAELVELAEALGELAREWLPTAETYTALTLSEPAADVHEPLVDRGPRKVRGRSAARRAEVPTRHPTSHLSETSTRSATGSPRSHPSRASSSTR